MNDINVHVHVHVFTSFCGVWTQGGEWAHEYTAFFLHEALQQDTWLAPDFAGCVGMAWMVTMGKV